MLIYWAYCLSNLFDVSHIFEGFHYGILENNFLTLSTNYPRLKLPVGGPTLVGCTLPFYLPFSRIFSIYVKYYPAFLT
jgi:hypothetical protein